MKEFIEKLIGRLEERKKAWTAKGIVFSHAGGTEIVDEMAFGTGNGLHEAIEIVNQLAEEHNNDFCEWYSDYKFISDKYKRETGCGYTFYDLHHAEPFKFCPYCGKKIKVIE